MTGPEVVLGEYPSMLLVAGEPMYRAASVGTFWRTLAAACISLGQPVEFQVIVIGLGRELGVALFNRPEYQQDHIDRTYR